MFKPLCNYLVNLTSCSKNCQSRRLNSNSHISQHKLNGLMLQIKQEFLEKNIEIFFDKLFASQPECMHSQKHVHCLSLTQRTLWNNMDQAYWQLNLQQTCYQYQGRASTANRSRLLAWWPQGNNRVAGRLAATCFWLCKVIKLRKKLQTIAIGLPMVFLSKEYLIASSSALWARPTAPEATGGRVLSKAPIAILNP